MLGWDFGAAMAMARAGGVSEAALYEFLPWIEAEMVRGEAARREGRDGAPDTE